MTTQEMVISSAHGAQLHAHIFDEAGAKATLVVAAALGVPQSYYKKFGEFCAAQGVRTITFSYRGIESSTLGTLSGYETKLQHWGQHDTDAVIAHALKNHPNTPTYLIGHSCGGQVCGLAPSTKHLSGIIFVAAQSSYWQHWPWPSRLGMGALFYAFLPALNIGGPYLRAKRLRIFPLDIPSGVIRQWTQWGRRPGYLFDPAHQIDPAHYQNYRDFDRPILAYSFPDDTYAPPRAVAALLQQFPRAPIEHRTPNPKDHGGKIGHFGFFHPRCQDTLWTDTVRWINSSTQDYLN